MVTGKIWRHMVVINIDGVTNEYVDDNVTKIFHKIIDSISVDNY